MYQNADDRKHLINRILVLEERIDRENNENFDDNYVQEQQSDVPLPNNDRVMSLKAGLLNLMSVTSLSFSLLIMHMNMIKTPI